MCVRKMGWACVHLGDRGLTENLSAIRGVF